MNLDETKKYIDQRLNSLGWAVHIDKAGYENIHRHARGAEDRLNQLYYKLVSIGSRRPKREINGEVLRAAIDDLTRMAEMLEHTQRKAVPNNNPDNERLSIEQLAKELETLAASELKADRKATAAGVTAKPRGNGAQDTARKAAGAAALPTILIADDSPTIRAVVTKALGNNFSIVKASDGEEAWDLLHTNNDIELVVTDLMMPKLDGFDLIRRIRSDKAPSRLVGLPIIVVTTLEDTNAKIRALVAGANDFITKNTGTAELQARVLARHKLAQTMKRAQTMKGVEWRRISDQKPSPAMPPHPANTPGSASAPHATDIPRPSAKPGAQDNPSQHRVATGSKPETGKPEGQHPTTRGLVNPVTPGRVRPSVDKINQLGSVTSKGVSRFNSTIAITIIATLLVALMIAGIIYLNQPDPAEKSVDRAQTDAPAVKERVDSDQQQQLSTRSPPELSSPASKPSLASTPPKVAPSAASEKDITGPKGQDQSSKAERDGSAEKASTSRSDKAMIPGESADLTQQAGPQGQPVAAADPTKTSVAPAQPMKALPTPEEHSPPGVAADNVPLPDVPVPARLPQHPSTDGSSVARLDRNKADSSIAPVAPVSASNKINQTELATLIKKFVSVYEAGDIDQFLSLFDKDVRTNDRTSKAGLREDYEKLFRTTEMRQMVLGSVTWELNDNQAHGWGNFEVKVRKTGAQETKAYNGSLMFHVEKRDGRLFIKHLYHGQQKAGAG